MVYLDHAATTPMRQSAIDAWVEHAGALNAGSQHAAGRRANAVLADARERIASALGADPVEVVFTGSGTEANNIGVRGLWDAAGGGRVVSTPIEHPAVLEVVKSLGQTGANVVWLPVGRDGVVEDLSALDAPAAVAAVAAWLVLRWTTIPRAYLAPGVVAAAGVILARAPWTSGSYAGDSLLLSCLCAAGVACLFVSDRGENPGRDAQ